MAYEKKSYFSPLIFLNPSRKLSMIDPFATIFSMVKIMINTHNHCMIGINFDTAGHMSRSEKMIKARMAKNRMRNSNDVCMATLFMYERAFPVVDATFFPTFPMFANTDVRDMF